MLKGFAYTDLDRKTHNHHTCVPVTSQMTDFKHPDLLALPVRLISPSNLFQQPPNFLVSSFQILQLVRFSKVMQGVTFDVDRVAVGGEGGGDDLFQKGRGNVTSFVSSFMGA